MLPFCRTGEDWRADGMRKEKMRRDAIRWHEKRLERMGQDMMRSKEVR